MWILIIILAAIIISLTIFIGLKFRKKSDLDDPLNPAQIKKRKENLDKILSLASQKTQITNSETAKYLGVNDDTAARYLEYLVSLNKLVRIANRGQQAFYRL